MTRGCTCGATEGMIHAEDCALVLAHGVRGAFPVRRVLVPDLGRVLANEEVPSGPALNREISIDASTNVVTFYWDRQVHRVSFEMLAQARVSLEDIPEDMWNRAREEIGQDIQPIVVQTWSVEEFERIRVNLERVFFSALGVSTDYFEHINTRWIERDLWVAYAKVLEVIYLKSRKPSCSCGATLYTKLVHADYCNVSKYMIRHSILPAELFCILRSRPFIPKYELSPEDFPVIKSVKVVPGIGRISQFGRVFVFEKKLIDAISLVTEMHMDTCDDAVCYMAGSKRGVISYMQKMTRDKGCGWMPGFSTETLSVVMADFAAQGYDCVGYIRLYRGLRNAFHVNLGPVLSELSRYAPGFFLLSSGQDGIELFTKEGEKRYGIHQRLLIKEGHKVYEALRTVHGSLKEQLQNLNELKGGDKNEDYLIAVSQASNGGRFIKQGVNPRVSGAA